jgi:hypothetical protein
LLRDTHGWSLVPASPEALSFFTRKPLAIQMLPFGIDQAVEVQVVGLLFVRG